MHYETFARVVIEALEEWHYYLDLVFETFYSVI